MVVKPDWDIFKSNFAENPQRNFEWMCYQLFCREFGKDKGIFRFYNQPTLETEPIEYNNDIIGFQAKFYTVNLSERRDQILKIISDLKITYPNLTILYFYTNRDWTPSSTADDRKTRVQNDIEKYALVNGIKIEWKTKSYFESEFVTIKNADITQYFFDSNTNEYYKKIKKIQKEDIEISESEMFLTSLYIKEQERDTEYSLCGKNILSVFILDQLKNSELHSFPDIFIRGVAGIGKSTEMKIAYNKLLEKCSGEDCYREFHFLPTPYFFELKNYQEGCFKINDNENPILFLDGIDEIQNSKLLPFIKDLSNLKSRNSSVKFIISGRDAAFPSEINGFKHIDVRLSFYIDSELQNLIYHFKGTVFEPFVGIPFYRLFLCSTNFKNIKTYKEFITTLITSRLAKDKEKSDRSENVLSSTGAGIDINHIQNTLAKFSYDLFKSKKRIFSTEDIKKYFNITEYSFVLKSCIFDYKNDNTISFFSNIYFEFFVAKYYSKKNYSLVRKELFISTGKVNVQYVNIIAILMNYISNTTKLYKKISKQLKQETGAYILLTDYIRLSIETRYHFYKKIVEEYNNRKKIIYYLSFKHQKDLLKNIDSLSDAVHKLLPEDFYDVAIKIHCDTILNFIKNPVAAEIATFENAVILLGVHSTFWQEKQQDLLKEISIPLIKFFRENELAKQMKNLLSEDIIFGWYQDYNWTAGWGEKEWQSFIKEILNDIHMDFYSFKSEAEFRIKLKLFIHFHKNIYIGNLLVPFAKKILINNENDIGLASAVPYELDDEFKTPILHFDNDIAYFYHILKTYEITMSDTLDILNSCACDYIQHNLPYQTEEIYIEIINRFKNNIHHITDVEMPELYKLFVTYINTESAIYISDFSEYIKLLNDNQKKQLFVLLEKDLRQKVEWRKLWMLRESIVILLDITKKEDSCLLFELLKEIDNIYRGCIAYIYARKLNEHPLYGIAVSEYPKLFPEQLKKDEICNRRIAEFEAEKQTMFNKEIDIILNKENLLNEINHIFNYLDKTVDSSKKDTARSRLLDLRIDHIGGKIKYDYEENHSDLPIFSQFVIEYLFACTRDDRRLDRMQAIKNIEDWFSDEKYFWRYFFWLYICRHKKEETDSYLKKYPGLREKITNSMEKEASCFLENDSIDKYDDGENRFWVVPFVHYINRLYNNKLPKWVDKIKVLNFIAFPAWQLATEFYCHINSEFKWGKWNSVFDWIEEVAGISSDAVIKEALTLLPKLKSDQSQTQIIAIFVKNVKSESVYRQDMLDAIFDKTIIEIRKDYKDHNHTSIMNTGALSSFWYETGENFVERIYPYIDFSKYDSNDVNYCRKAVLEYFCKAANQEQKNKVIFLLKNRIAEFNIKIYLAKLGYEKAIIKLIDEFLDGANFNTNLIFHTPLFGKSKKSMRQLNKYYQLYKYSMEKDNDRRRYLMDYARVGILQTVIKHNFWFIKWKLNKLIKKLKMKGLYFEGIQDFLNEIEQKIFGDDN